MRCALLLAAAAAAYANTPPWQAPPTANQQFITSLAGLGSTPIGLTPLGWPVRVAVFTFALQL